MIERIASHLRLSRVALAAIAGMLLVAGDASACTTSDGAKAVKSCCATPRPKPKKTACGCCAAPAAEPVRAPRPGQALPAPVGSALTPVADSCSCRPAEPTAPAPRHESRTPEHRPDQIGVAAAPPAPVVRPSDALASRLGPGESHAGVPIFALTSRLRF